MKNTYLTAEDLDNEIRFLEIKTKIDGLLYDAARTKGSESDEYLNQARELIDSLKTKP